MGLAPVYSEGGVLKNPPWYLKNKNAQEDARLWNGESYAVYVHYSHLSLIYM